MASGGIKTCIDAEGAIKMGADLVAVGRAVVVDPEWLSKVRSKSEASILAGLPKDELEIARALSIPPRMVEYLLSRPGWIPMTLDLAFSDVPLKLSLPRVAMMYRVM
jgi:tRNA-dihydrouridine synthase